MTTTESKIAAGCTKPRHRTNGRHPELSVPQPAFHGGRRNAVPSASKTVAIAAALATGLILFIGASGQIALTPSGGNSASLTTLSPTPMLTFAGIPTCLHRGLCPVSATGSARWPRWPAPAAIRLAP